MRFSYPTKSSPSRRWPPIPTLRSTTTPADSRGSPDGAGGLLPLWYMPAPGAGASAVTGWRRAAAMVVIAAFLLITVLGLCNTYGDLAL